jgi:serine/threonine-protein kinase
MAYGFILAQRLGRAAEAQEWAADAEARTRNLDALEPMTHHLLLLHAGAVLYAAGRLPEALERFRRSVVVIESFGYGLAHARALNNLAATENELGQTNQAIVDFQRAVAEHEAAQGPDHAEVAMTLLNLGPALQAVGRLDEARAALRRCASIFERSAPDHPFRLHAIVPLGDVELEAGNTAAARKWYEGAIARAASVSVPDRKQLVRAHLGLARCALASANTAAGRAHVAEARGLATRFELMSDTQPELDFAEAQVLWSSDPARARALATAAEGALAKHLPAAKHDHGAVTAWLQAHATSGKR